MSANDQPPASGESRDADRPTRELMSFEADLSRVESIINELESEDLGLDRALKLFEEGVERLRAAAAALTHAEDKVRLLVEQTDGSFTVAELDG